MKRLSVVTQRLLLACVVTLCASLAPAAQAADAVLGSDAAERASIIHETISSNTTLELGAVRIVPGSVIIPVQDGEESFRLLAPGLMGHKTVHGALQIPSVFPASELPELLEKLNQISPPLTWKIAQKDVGLGAYEIQEERARRLRDARMRSLKLREGEDGASVDFKAFEGQRFAFSRWLAQGGEGQEPGADDSRWNELKEAMRAFPKSEPGVFGAREKIRGAPKLWAYAAMAAERRGQFVQALAYADVATRFAQPDADALRVWERLTQQKVRIPTDASPSLMGAPKTADNHHISTLLIILGLLAWLWLIRREGRARLIIGTGACLIALAALIAASSDSPSSSKLNVPELPQALQAPLAGGACVADPMMWSTHGYSLFATCDGHPVSFEISREDDSGIRVEALGETIGSSAESARAHLDILFNRAVEAGWKLTARPADGGLGSRRAVTLSAGDRIERGLTAMLACLACLMLLIVGRECWRIIRANMRRDPALSRLIIGLFVLIVIAHLAVDSRMVMVYTG